MTEQKTITESQLANAVEAFKGEWANADADGDKVGRRSELGLRNALDALGITVVPDPAPPLPTKGGWYLDRDGDAWYLNEDDQSWWYDHRDDADPWEARPFDYLETQVEGDARVLATLRHDEVFALGTHWYNLIQRVLREAREANP